MKTTIRRKLLRSIIAVLTTLYVVVCVVTCLFLRGQLIRQAHRDNRQVLLQVSQQLDVIVQLTDMTARQVMTDEELYTVIHETRIGKPSQKFVTMSRANNILRRYMALNPFVANIGVISWDTLVFSNRGPFMADDYRQRTESDWFRDFMAGSERMTMSDVYTVLVDNSYRDVVSLVYKYRNIQEGTERDNYMIIDIVLTQFADLLEDSGRLLVVNDRGQTIVPSDLIEAQDLAGSSLDDVIDLPGVVALYTPMESVGWSLFYSIPRSEFNRPITVLLLGLVALFLAVLAVSILGLSRLIGRIVEPVHSITTTMQAAYNGNLNVHAEVKSGDELEILSDCFNKLIEDLRSYVGRMLKDEAVKKQMQMDLLMSQIHPHFIYNTLNSAVYFIEEESGEQAIEVIYALIDILQDTVRIGSKEIFTTVEKELELCRAYVTIAEARYPEAFRVEIACDPALVGERIPKVLIQPLVENAIHHGILPAGRGGTVTVAVSSRGEALVIRVEDDGVGLDQARLSDALRGQAVRRTVGSHGVGLLNIQNRIRFLYGEDGGFDIAPREGGGTRVEVVLPVNKPAQGEGRAPHA